jgi:hypothetical protein
MRHLLAVGLAVLILAPAIRAADEPPDKDKAKTPRERYQALFQEHQKAMEQFMAVYQKAKTNQERTKLVEEKYPQPQSYLRRFFEIADSAPQDPAAVDALIWIVQHGGNGPEVNRALDRLATSHAGHPGLGEVAPRLANSVSPSAERLLKAILETNPDRQAKARACLGLGRYYKQQSELVHMLKTEPKQAQQVEAAYKRQGLGDELAALGRKDSNALLKDAEAMFERAAKDFADVSDYRGTIGKSAQAELNEIQKLGIDKPAPEITGVDIDGQSFKLSDYKGKVVVVDFWGDW